jgi:hypothetical protein
MDRTKPCKDCPFRHDRRMVRSLGGERVAGILRDVVDGGRTFTCHETTPEGASFKGKRHDPKKEQHCAGALILLEKLERPNQLMRIFERLGGYDRTKLKMDSPVFDSAEDMQAAADEGLVV